MRSVPEEPRYRGPEDLIDGIEVVAAGRFITEITSATNSLTY